VTVTKTVDDDTYQAFALPTSLSGTVYIRVLDTDRTKFNKSVDTIRIDHMYIEALGTPPPNLAPYMPAAPDPLNGQTDVSINADLSWDGGDPNATDDVYYDVYFGTGSPPPFFERIGPYSAAQTRITYDPSTMATNTLYYWQIVAEDDQGLSTDGPVWSFTTGDTPPQIFHANQDISVQNGGLSGSYVDTQASENVYEGIQERESVGKPSNRHTYLEHKWTIDVTGGYPSYTFYLEAYHTANSENDDFEFSYSTNDASYTSMVTVTKTTDDGTYQAFALPSSLSGTVYIRVMDTDQSAGNRVRDTIFVDHMYISAQ
jgi:hypothetical protein